MAFKKPITVGEASKILRVSERQIRRYCNEGKLNCEKEGKAFTVSYDSVLSFIDKHTSGEADVDSDTVEDMSKSTVSQEDTDMADNQAGTRIPLSESSPPMSDSVADISSDRTSVPTSENRGEADNSDSTSDVPKLVEEFNRTIDVRLQEEKQFVDLMKSYLTQLAAIYESQQQQNAKAQGTLKQLLADLTDSNSVA